MISQRILLCGTAMVFASASATMAASPWPDVWNRLNDNDASVSYSPHMEQKAMPGYYDGDMHDSTAPGEWCAFSFTGTGVKWIGSKNVDHGQAEVYLDGQLDATVDGTAASWLRQQELYTKTGLTNGPHMLKIVIKTNAYQDFDAFEYLAPPPRKPGAPKLEGATLPAQVPYLNTPNRYPIGNGLVMAVCGATGQGVQLAGPGYTTSNFINSEDLALELDGIEQPLRVEMKRAEKTGIFYGSATRGDLDVCLIDYACAGQPWFSRLILVNNTSATASHDIRLRARIEPQTGNGYSHWLAKDAAGNSCGFAIQADTSIGVPYGGNNIADRSVTISFNDPTASVSISGDEGAIETKPIKLSPHGHEKIALNHYFRQGHDMSDPACVDAIRGLNNVANLEKAIAEWQSWIDHVEPRYSLARIKGERARQLVEGALVILKTNQSQDGGIIAHTTFYKEGYVRDAAMAVRGLLAAGHTEEAKQWLIWIDHKLSIHGHLGDAMNCEPALADKSCSFDMGDMEVEEPGWVLLCARDYYSATHDLATLKALDKTLRYCMDVQLKEASANGGKLEFNGDETEICGAVDIHATGVAGGGDAVKQDWSLSSIAMAAAALDFHIQYVKLCGDNPAAYHNAQTNTTMNLPTELANLVAAMDRDFWRTDVPESPGGFHDFFRKKSDGAWPQKRLANFTLMPVFFSTPYAADKKAKDVDAIARSFNTKTGLLQLVPGADNGLEGHDLGYLLWGLVETGDGRKDQVYSALVNGPTVDAWGSFNEAYDAAGHPNDHDLRSLETGVNVSALAKYWGLGAAAK